MSEFVIDDWKLKARTVVKLYRKNTNMLVSCYRETLNCLSVSFNRLTVSRDFITTVHLHCTEVKDLQLTK